MIYLKEIIFKKEKVQDHDQYPYSIPALKNFHTLHLESGVTFFVGENGSGKSTLLEALAIAIGFNPLGGNRNHTYADTPTESSLHTALHLSWMPKTHKGFFLRAESFFQFATAIDRLDYDEPPAFVTPGAGSLHTLSHGESFFAVFSNRFRDGIFLMDEPESALSPMRQLSLMRIIKDKLPRAQFIIATHSPILLAYPDAQILNFGEQGIKEMRYDALENVQLYKNFLSKPERYLEHLFSDEE